MQIQYLVLASIFAIASAQTTTVTPTAKATITTTLSAGATPIFGCMIFGGPGTCCQGALVSGVVSISQAPDDDDEPATTTSAPLVMVSVEARHCVGTVYEYRMGPAPTTASVTSISTSNAAVPTAAAGNKWEMLGIAAVAVVGVVV